MPHSEYLLYSAALWEWLLPDTNAFNVQGTKMCQSTLIYILILRGEYNGSKDQTQKNGR